MTIKQILIYRLENSDVSINKICQSVGVSSSTVYKFINDRQHTLTLGVAEKLLDYFEIKVIDTRAAS